MTDWVDFFVYAVLLVIVWVGIPALQSRFTLFLVADRNPDWLATHPAAARKLNDSRWFLWSCYVMGALSLAALLPFQLGVWRQMPSVSGLEAETWMVLWDISAASVIAFVIFFFGCGYLFARWLRKEVPLAERRHAALDRRSIDDFVPRVLRVVIYALVVIHLAAWLAVGVTGRYSTPAFWGTMAFQFVISGIFLFIAHGNVRRRPNAMDRIFGPGYRRNEVRYAFIAQLIPLGNGLARLYEETAGTVIVDVNRALQLGLVVLIILLFLRFALFSRGSDAGAALPPDLARPSNIASS